VVDIVGHANGKLACLAVDIGNFQDDAVQGVFAEKEAKHLLAGNDKVRFAENANDALAGADALAIVTEWKTFRAPDFVAMKAALKSPVVFDGRNLYEPSSMHELGFAYYPIGRAQAKGN
jgi:UDPglucose 6-dehydrogenase